MKSLERGQAHIGAAALERLRGAGPGVFEVEDSWIGLPTMRFRGDGGAAAYIHSPEDPLDESAAFARGLAGRKRELYAFVGFGLGYPAAALLPLLPVGSRIVVFEPSFEAMALAMGAAHLGAVLEHPKVFFVIGDDFDSYADCAVDFMGDFVTGDEAEFFVGPHAELFGGYKDAAISFLRGIHLPCLVAKKTRDVMQKRYQVNAAHNLKGLLKSASMSELRGIFRGVPIVVLGPGVGLMKSLKGLEALRRHCLVMCLHSAAPCVDLHSAAPDFIVAIDAQEVIFNRPTVELFRECEWLFADHACHELVDAYREKAFVYPAARSTKSALEAAGLPYYFFGSAFTVASEAVRLADYFGASQIALAGIDFQYYDGCRYPWMKPGDWDSKDLIEGTNIFGGPAQTNDELGLFAGELSKIAAESGARIVDIRETGRPIPGAEVMDWKAFMSGLPEIDRAGLMERYRSAAVDSDAMSVSRKGWFLRRCGSRREVLKAEVAALRGRCARITALGGAADVEALLSLFNAISALELDPVWSLTQGHFRRPPISLMDFSRAAPPEKRAEALALMSDYLEKTEDVMDATAAAFEYAPMERDPAVMPAYIKVKAGLTAVEHGRVVSLEAEEWLDGDAVPADGMISAISFDESGMMFVADEKYHRVRRIRPDGRADGTLGGRGNRPGEFFRPMDVLCAGGRVFAADAWNHRVQVFGPDGRIERAWGGKAGMKAGEFMEPWGLAAGPDNTIFVADRDNNRIQRLDMDGKVLSSFGKFGAVPGHLIFPMYAAAGKNGKLYVLDATGRVRRFTFGGVFEGEVLPWGVRGNMRAADGRLYFLEDYNRALRCVGEDGKVQWFCRFSDEAPAKSVAWGGIAVYDGYLYSGRRRFRLPAPYS